MKITKLKKHRLDIDMLQIELSDKTGIPIRTLQNYESGTTKPDVDRANLLAKALNTTVEEIFELPSKNISD